jgi:hypothetical protein
MESYTQPQKQQFNHPVQPRDGSSFQITRIGEQDEKKIKPDLDLPQNSPVGVGRISLVNCLRPS